MTPQTPKPLYEQVKDHIMDHIQSGAWAPDTRIPSENQLANEFSISRLTVNRALRELSDAGHLVRIQGVGTYVAHPKPLHALFEITSIDDEILNRGEAYSCEVHLLKKEEAFPELASAMEIIQGTPVYHSVIVHKSNEKPIMLADRYVNAAVVPGFIKQDFTRITPAKYLLKHVPITNVEHIVEALLPDVKMSKLLEISPHEPCLVLHRQTWADKRVVTHSKMTYPGSRYRIGGRFKPLPN